MTSFSIHLATRYLKATQPPGQRKVVKKLVYPINAPREVDKTLQKENAVTDDTRIEETGTPNKRDIIPKDVFAPLPNNMNVLNFVETGEDQSDQKVRKDKGWATVNNLSQYLIRTEGGGGTPPVGKKI